MATHSNTLVCRIPWTEEPGGLHTVHGVAKSRTSLSDFHFLFFFPSILPYPSLLFLPAFPLTAKHSQNGALRQLEKCYCFFSIPLQSSVSFLVYPFFLFLKTQPSRSSQPQSGTRGWGWGSDQPEWAPRIPKGSVQSPRQTHRRPPPPPASGSTAGICTSRPQEGVLFSNTSEQHENSLRVVLPGKEKKV